MHPGWKDYTQRLIAWSMLLDGKMCGLVEEFLREFRLSQFERERRLAEPGSCANELVKTGDRAEDKTNNQQPGAGAEPAIEQPANNQPTDYGSEERHGRAVSNAGLDVRLILVFVKWHGALSQR